jgi:hypothetical protein
VGREGEPAWELSAGTPTLLLKMVFPIACRIGSRRLRVIRFNCPLCGKVLKVADENAGSVVVCPRCQEPSLARAGDAPRAAPDREEGSNGQRARCADEPPGLLASMSFPIQCVVAAVAAAGILPLVMLVLLPLLHFRASVQETFGGWALILTPCALVILLVILYGQGTACPCCRRWWARTKVETEFVDRELFDKEGVPFAKSVYRTTYQCDGCQHRWSLTQAEEYREPPRACRKQHRC